MAITILEHFVLPEARKISKIKGVLKKGHRSNKKRASIGQG
jgi:hypothetical protein